MLKDQVRKMQHMNKSMKVSLEMEIINKNEVEIKKIIL
jgi:hypothetical protein